MISIPGLVDKFSAKIARLTLPFVNKKIGKIFLSLVIVGPFTFLPTLYSAWTAPNIDAFRTLTWPLMIVINASAFLGLAHKGNWRMRLVMILWTIIMTLVFLATLVR